MAGILQQWTIRAHTEPYTRQSETAISTPIRQASHSFAEAVRQMLITDGLNTDLHLDISNKVSLEKAD